MGQPVRDSHAVARMAAAAGPSWRGGGALVLMLRPQATFTSSTAKVRS